MSKKIKSTLWNAHTHPNDARKYVYWCAAKDCDKEQRIDRTDHAETALCNKCLKKRDNPEK